MMTARDLAPFPTFDALVLFVARLFRFIREYGGANKGVWVGALQRIGDGKPGDSWCADLVSMVLGICFQGSSNCPLPRTGSCAAIFAVALAEGWVTKTPKPGDLFFYLDATGHAHHVGFVTQTSPLVGFAGNTSVDGTSSNGDGAYEHALHPPATGSIAFVAYPRPPIQASAST